MTDTIGLGRLGKTVRLLGMRALGVMLLAGALAGAFGFLRSIDFNHTVAEIIDLTLNAGFILVILGGAEMGYKTAFKKKE